MSLDTFSYVILKRNQLQKLANLSSELSFEFVCLARNINKIYENLKILENSANSAIFLHRYEDEDEYKEINFYLKTKKFPYRNGREFSKVKLSIDQSDQSKFKILDSEIIIRLYFPAYWGTEFSEILEQKEEVIQLISYLQPEFGFSTNENEIERIYNFNYADLLKFERDWIIISNKVNDFLAKEISSSLTFKNSLTLGNVSWFDNL